MSDLSTGAGLSLGFLIFDFPGAGTNWQIDSLAGSYE